MLTTTPQRSMNVALLAVVVLFYLVRLDFSPVYLLNDEVFNALQSLSLARTGRSVAGDYFPVYFRGLEFRPGRDPLCIYATALALKLLPATEATLRLPTALVGVVNVLLAYFIGRRLWGNWRFALLTAACVALTPAHYINSRIGIPTLWSTPWLMAWLLAVIAYAQEKRPAYLFIATTCLGIAIYGYLGTALLAPLFFIGTLVFMRYSLVIRQLRHYAMAAAGFALPLALLGYWHVLHPERWSELVEYYTTNTSVLRESAPLFSASGLPNFAGIQERLTAYWNYFNPTLLFLSGDASPRYSTGRAGVFLLPALLLLPLGIYRAAHAPGVGRLLIFCAAAAPLAAALSADVQIQRALPLVVFGALLCAGGLVSLLSSIDSTHRRLGVALCIVGGIQFAAFVFDYFGHYRLRSGAWRGGNLRGAFERVIDTSRENHVPVIYLDGNIANIEHYWRFYAVALHADELADRAVTMEPSHLTDAPAGALFITGTQKGFTVSPADPDAWRLRERVYELDGPTFFSIFEKLR
jgi:4-amino-4-deoxy-L-arabinose transferase-like glycosyltransferase